MHVLLVGASRLLSHQRVIGAPIGQRRVQLFAIHVAGKRPGLPHQPVDDVPVVDPVLVLAPQTRQTLHQFLGIPDLDLLQADPRLHLQADQPRRHRVGVVLHLDGAAPTHTHTLPFQRLQAPGRQRPQARHLLGDLCRPARIALLEHAQEERPILFAVGKLSAATQEQRLLHGVFEMPMQRLHITILVPAGGIGRLGVHTVMGQQRPVLCRKLLGLPVVMDSQGHPVGAVTLGCGSQRPQRILQARAQAREALAQTERDVLPVGICQDKVIEQVRKGHACNGHLQIVHRSEVRGCQPARAVFLAEEYLLGRAVQTLPLPHTPLEGPAQGVRILTRLRPLQPVPEGLRL
jgi:hypothetical protein